MKKVGIMANPRRDIDLEYTKNVIGFLQNKVKIYIEEEIVPFLALITALSCSRRKTPKSWTLSLF